MLTKLEHHARPTVVQVVVIKVLIHMSITFFVVRMSHNFSLRPFRRWNNISMLYFLVVDA